MRKNDANADRSYCMRMIPTAKGAPRLSVTMSKGDANPAKQFGESSEVVQDVDPRDAHWLEHGLAVLLYDNKGIFCPAEVHAWHKRDEPLVPTYLDDSAEENGSPKRPEAGEVNGAEAMDVDEARLPEPIPAA